MNENERIELEAENDGYTNDYQRAHAAESIRNPRVNETSKALALVAQGKTVVMHSYPVYCRITDGILGTNVVIASVGDDYESAVGPVLNDMACEHEFGDGQFYVLPQPPVVPSVMEPVTNDDIPF